MFHWLEVRAFCHATEDEEKVVAAMRTVLPEGEIRREKLGGHFGNPIVSLVARTERAADIRAVWGRLAHALGRDEILRGVAARLDEDAVFHMRLDKQRAFGGELTPAAEGDVIDVRAKVAAYPKKPEVVGRVFREFVEAL